MSKDLKITYTASATSDGGRHGQVKSSDGSINLGTTEPKELGGSGEEGKTNPEQLFAAGYAACFSSSAKLAAETMELDLKDEALKVTSHVSLGKDRQDNGLGLKIKIEMQADGLEEETKQRLLQKANDLCPYSKAIKGNVEVELVTK